MESILEEIILSNVFKISTFFFDETVERLEAKKALDKLAEQIFQNILFENLPNELRTVVNIAISDNVQDFFRKKRLAEEQNPQIILLNGKFIYMDVLQYKWNSVLCAEPRSPPLSLISKWKRKS